MGTHASRVALYLIIVCMGGAALSPVLFHAAQGLARVWPSFAPIADSPFHRLVNRSLLIIALAGLYPFLRSLGIRHWRDLGVSSSPKGLRELGLGAALGFASLAIVAAAAVAGGARTWNLTRAAGEMVEHLGNAIAAACVVGCMEELLFRGAIFGALRRGMNLPWALGISSGVYAIVHFFRRADSPETVEWFSGWIVLGDMLGGFAEVRSLMPGFLNLTIAGVILGLALERTGRLYFSIGLHAGWVFWLKTYGFTTINQPETSEWMWGTGRMIDGWIAVPVLTATLLAVHRWIPKRRSEPNTE